MNMTLPPTTTRAVHHVAAVEREADRRRVAGVGARRHAAEDAPSRVRGAYRPQGDTVILTGNDSNDIKSSM